MLTEIREKTHGIFATIIIALIGIPFALWGVNSYFDTGGELNVATVNGANITQRDYRVQIERLRGRVDPKTLGSLEFKQMLLNNLVEQAVITRGIEKQGYRIGNSLLAEVVRSHPDFQRDGKFDPALYSALLRRQGIKPQDFEASMRDEILLSQVQSGISDSRIVTQSEMAEMIRLMSQERDVAYALIVAESLMSGIRVSEEEVAKYYSGHPELFKIPEAVRVEYLQLSAAEQSQNRQPTNEELKRAYAEEASRFVTPEKRHASHILITLPAQPTENQTNEALAIIERIAKQARQGADFATLAKRHSADDVTAPLGGDLGEIRRGAMPKELEDAVLSLKLGEISQPVRSAYGYHLVKLTAYTPEKRKTVDEVRKELVDSIRRRDSEERFFDSSEKFRNLVYEQPDSLLPAAKALGLEIQKSDWFTQAGGTGLASSPKVVQAAFEPDVLSQARNSDVIDISADTMVAIRVADRRPAGRQPLAEVRTQVERILKQERALLQARQIGEAALGELRTGASLDALARKRGLKYSPQRTLTRRQAAGVDPRVVDQAFQLPRPEDEKPVYGLVDLGNRGYALLALRRVRDAMTNLDADLKKQIQAHLDARRGIDYFSHYRAGLRQKAEIKTYPEQL